MILQMLLLGGCSGQQGEAAYITAEQAKELALAKVPGAAAGDIVEFEAEIENGRSMRGKSFIMIWNMNLRSMGSADSSWAGRKNR